MVEPIGHRPGGVTFGFLRRFSVLLIDRRNLKGLGGAAQSMTAQRRDVGNVVLPADDDHSLNGDLEAVDTMFVESHVRLRVMCGPEWNVSAWHVSPATSV